MSELAPESAIRHTAITLLARREHTQSELVQKLCRRFPEQSEQVAAVIQQLQEDNLQSDQRFAEGFVRYRAGQGYGPRRLAAEMAQKGVAADLIDQALQSQEIDWAQCAAEVYHKKFGQRPVQDFAERAKRQRFMQYRGFDWQLIAAMLDVVE